MTQATLYYNPKCNTCRQVKALLEERNVAVEVVEYLDGPLTADLLQDLLRRLGVSAFDLVREKDLAALEGPRPESEAELVALMVQQPRLVQRPIVVVADRAVVARPPERVLEIL